MHPHETNPPYSRQSSIDEDTRVKTTIRKLVVGAVSLVVLVATAVTMWNHQENRIDLLNMTAADHTVQLTAVQGTVGNLRDDLRTVKANQDAQLELLKFLANNRKGPLPESAK